MSRGLSKLTSNGLRSFGSDCPSSTLSASMHWMYAPFKLTNNPLLPTTKPNIHKCITLVSNKIPCRRDNSTTTTDATPPNSQTTTTPPPSSNPQRLIVFGGSGFVGSRVCQHAVQQLNIPEVIAVSRHGRPQHLANTAWADTVQWVNGDALDPQQPWKELMEGATGVVSTLGAFGNNEFMYKVCGTANMALMQAAKEVGTHRFAFISVHDYKLPSGWQTQNFLLKGYFQGKRDAEAKLAELFPTTGVALRPGFIYGSRKAGNMTIPLGLLGAPLSAALKLMPTRSMANLPVVGGAFVPPTSVEVVGKAAAEAGWSDDVGSGVLDVWEIHRRFG